jgi:hypothetical protein
MKLEWRVGEAPTGRYRSFHHRGWPCAEFADGRNAAMIQCEDSYVPANARDGKHAPLFIYIADYSAGESFKWRKLKMTAATLDEAKAIAANFWAKRPELAAAVVNRPQGPEGDE